MAETEVLLEENQTEDQEEVSEPQSRRGGRPPGARNKPKESIPFFDLIRTVDYNNHQIHLFRVEPLTDRKRTGDYAYIQKFAEPFDEDTVLKDPTWGGSGVYRATLYYEPPGTKKQKEVVAEKYFEVIDQAYPPRFPLSQWIDEPKNKKWAWAREVMEREQGKDSSNRGGGSRNEIKEVLQEIREGQVSPKETFSSMMSAHQTGVKQGIEMAKQSAPAAAGDSGVVELLKTFIPLLKPTPPPPPDNSIVEMLKLQIQMQEKRAESDREQSKADREAAERRAEAAEKRHDALMTGLLAEKKNTGFDVIEQFTKMFGAFQQLNGAGLGATDESWSGIFKEGLREAAPDLMRTLAPGVGAMLGGLGQGAPRIPPPSVSRETLSTSVPPAQGQPASVAQPAAAQPPPPFDPQFTQAYTCIFMSQSTLLNYMRTGRSGLDFGDWLADGPGAMEIEKIKAAGPENIMKFIATQIPPLWAELQPVQVKFQQFLGELMAWEPQEDDPEGNNSESVSRETLEVLPGGTSNAKGKGGKKPAGGKPQ